ncbi:MAG: STAS domain-containing protein [Phototrophicaceae bacterium]|jgi:anti-sigma B factor antagonist
MINVNVKKFDSVTLVEVNGRVDSMNADQFGEALLTEIDSGNTKVVLDLAGVDYMSSAGLREIVTALKKVKRNQGDLRIAQPSERVMEVLEIAGLNTIVQIFPSQSAAVGSYSY